MGELGRLEFKPNQVINGFWLGLIDTQYRGQSCHCWSDCTAALAYNYSASTFYCHTACSQALGHQLEHCHSLYKCHITRAQGQHMPQPLHAPVCIRQNPFFQLDPPAACAPLMRVWQLLTVLFQIGEDKTLRAWVCTSSHC